MHPTSKQWKDATVHTKASKWAKVGEVLAKVRELQAEASARNETTVDMIDKMHKAAFSMAQKTEKASAMTLAANNLAKLHGLIVDKNETNLGVSSDVKRTLADFYAEQD